jgi:hypothetical protein
VATLLYLLLGWLLINVAFALGMYFRPVRKSSLGSADYLDLQMFDPSLRKLAKDH